VNNSPFIGVHFTENEWRSGGADSLCRVLGHGAKFSLASGPEALDVNNKSLSLVQFATESLIKKVLQRLQELSALGLQ
jgi:hypothetical protein